MTKKEIIQRLREKVVEFRRAAHEPCYAQDEMESQYYSGKESAFESAAYDLEYLIHEFEAK